MHDAVCPTDGVATIPVMKPEPATYPMGTLIADRYRIDAVLGIGGFGAVYKCTQTTMNQTVAVKVLRSEHLASVEHVKRFTREAQAVSKLKHPNTIHIFDFGVHTDGALYLAMEYLEGETLAHRLDRNGLIYWEDLVKIMGQVCHSLTEAHAVGLVHRDLKPENIMLLPVAGDPNFVKVLDFGIAKVQKNEGAGPRDASLTEAGMIMGTPTYMSPEQARGELIDARSDLYSLGIMMYEALTGKPPFQGDSAMTVLVAHIKDPPRAMPRDGSIPHVPAELERVVLGCLEKEPARRPQTAVQLVDRLQSAVRQAREPANTTVSPPPPAPSELPTSAMAPVVPDTSAIKTAAISPLAPQAPAALAAQAAAALAAQAAAVGPLGLQGPAAAPTPTPVPALPVPAPSRAPLYVGLGAFAAVAAIAGVAVALLDQPASTEAPPVPPESAVPAKVSGLKAAGAAEGSPPSAPAALQAVPGAAAPAKPAPVPVAPAAVPAAPAPVPANPPAPPAAKPDPSSEPGKAPAGPEAGKPVPGQDKRLNDKVKPVVELRPGPTADRPPPGGKPAGDKATGDRPGTDKPIDRPAAERPNQPGPRDTKGDGGRPDGDRGGGDRGGGDRGDGDKGGGGNPFRLDDDERKK